jgi:glyoxylase-like metal-dependent hydrolase (beta-lactamase superfamily II)
MVVRLAGEGPLLAVPGFAGVAVFPAGGHTPCSQVIVARVGDRTLAFAGDLVNEADGIRHDVPKPFLYSLLLVPEASGRLATLRRWLRELQDHDHVLVLPSHDEAALRASALSPWRPEGAP